MATRDTENAGSPGSARPVKSFLEDAQQLELPEFQTHHGNAFLLGTAAGLTEPAGPTSTDVKLMGFDDEDAVHTAGLSVLVYPVRRPEHAVGHLVTVGRASNNDVVVNDASVSRFHAFAKEGDAGGLLVQDVGSTNGTTVNGASVPAKGAGPPAVMKPGDTLRLGQVEFTFVDAAGLRGFLLKSIG